MCVLLIRLTINDKSVLIFFLTRNIKQRISSLYFCLASLPCFNISEICHVLHISCFFMNKFWSKCQYVLMTKNDKNRRMYSTNKRR